MPSSPFLEALGTLLSTYANERGLDVHDVVNYVEDSVQSRSTSSSRDEQDELHIPLIILSDRRFGILEVLTKYLKEHHDLKYSEIAELLSRDDRTIWSCYAAASEKHRDRLEIPSNGDGAVRVPASLFRDRRLGPLEAVSHYLREDRGHSYAEIAELLNRDSRTIWTACRRARKKADGGRDDTLKGDAP